MIRTITIRVASTWILLWGGATVDWADAQDKYAVVIGVETYDTSTFDNLEFAADDAEELGKTLTRLGFRTTVMSSESRSSRLRPTTPRKITDVIRSVVASCANGDTLALSLSGHGVQFADEGLLSSGVRETYFCPGDADLADKSTLLKISAVVNFMNGSAAGRKLLLVDACREQVLSAEGRRKSAKRIEVGSVYENRRSVPGGIAVLFSCSSGQFSWEHDAIRHSVFTHHVINYLNGKAEPRFYDRGEVDLSGMVFYVQKRTNDYVIGKNLSADGQLPVLRGSSANWPLGRIKVSDPKELTNSIGMKFVRIESGTFTMGTANGFANEKPTHEVTLTRPFYLGMHEVTQKQWNMVMPAAKRSPWKGKTYAIAGDEVAASYVSWNDAQEFLSLLNRRDRGTGRRYRLPTEAEWEYACRAGSRTAYSFGDAESELNQYAWWDGNADSQKEAYAHMVGQKRPNAWGLYDMHGNVWEWCQDYYGGQYYAASPQRDPTGPGSGSSRVLRGGSWYYYATNCRSANRYNSDPSNRDYNVGFRVVCVLLD